MRRGGGCGKHGGPAWTPGQCEIRYNLYITSFFIQPFNNQLIIKSHRIDIELINIYIFIYYLFQ